MGILMASGWWFQTAPLKNMTSSVGMMKFPIDGKIIRSCSKPPTSHCARIFEYSSAQKFYSRKHVAWHGWNLPKPFPCSPQAKLTDHRSYHWAWEISNFDSSELAIISCTTMLVAHVPWSKHCIHIYIYTHTCIQYIMVIHPKLGIIQLIDTRKVPMNW